MIVLTDKVPRFQASAARWGGKGGSNRGTNWLWASRGWPPDTFPPWWSVHPGWWPRDLCCCRRTRWPGGRPASPWPVWEDGETPGSQSRNWCQTLMEPAPCFLWCASDALFDLKTQNHRLLENFQLKSYSSMKNPSFFYKTFRQRFYRIFHRFKGLSGETGFFNSTNKVK